MAYRPITIDALRIGMHVAKFDVMWFRSPFLRHSFLIRTDEQIEKLRRAGIKRLQIDLARGIDVRKSSDPLPDRPIAVAKLVSLPTGETPRVRSLAAMTEELHTARTARAQLEQSVMVTDRYDELLRGFGGASPLTPHQSLQRLYQPSPEPPPHIMVTIEPRAVNAAWIATRTVMRRWG